MQTLGELAIPDQRVALTPGNTVLPHGHDFPRNLIARPIIKQQVTLWGSL